MNEQMRLSKNTVQLLLARYPRFGRDLASISIEFHEHLKYHTAATDGKKIYLDPHFFASLDDEDRLFILAHEILHIKFLHHLRLEKNGVKKDLEVWNEATDAIINANLERDGFKIKKGYVNIPGALHYSAEELYMILLKKRESKKGKDDSNSDDYEVDIFKDDHSMWEESFEKYQNSSNKEQEDRKESEIEEIHEAQELTKNRQERMKKAKESFERMREKNLQKMLEDSTPSSISIGNVGKENNAISWELLLRREIEKTETIWSQRRSIFENNYAYRLEENDVEENVETEVQIDVSGSVNLNLVKSFLKIIKPILKHSKLKVGCFNEKFWGWVEIKNLHDIDNFMIPKDARDSSAWTEDWDLAVRSFSKKREVNKIVFTDGYPCPGTMPKEDLKGEQIIWIVYGNKNFQPCCGKVIQITQQQLEQLNNVEQAIYSDRTR